MLVLGRKAGETIVIAGNIRVTVLEVEGERIRLGIDAPRSVPVIREEILVAIEEENRQAAVRRVDSSALQHLSGVIGAAAAE
jgi:carbon storage regulator